MDDLTMEIVQYFVVNKDLKMSTGKIAGQVAHVATSITKYLERQDYYEVKRAGEVDDPDYIEHDRQCDLFDEWYENHNQTKIILKAKEKDLLKLIDQGWFYVRDNGKTEIPQGTLTVVGCLPNYRSDLQKIVKRFQLL